MAAGASPQKAQTFVENVMFQKGAPVTSLGGTKPKGPNEWYNESYASASQSLYPQGFRPPATDTTEFKGYFDFVYGKGSYDKVALSTQKTKAPTYSKALTSPVGTFEYIIANGIKDGLSPETVITNLTSLDKNGKIRGVKTPEQVNSYVYKIFDEFSSSQSALANAYNEQINKNRDYKYGLPDPKLRYGASTNLSAGTVDVLSNPTAAKAFAQYSKSVTDPAKLSAYKNFLVTEVNKRQITPWKDEARRRDALKGTKFGK